MGRVSRRPLSRGGRIPRRSSRCPLERAGPIPRGALGRISFRPLGCCGRVPRRAPAAADAAEAARGASGIGWHDYPEEEEERRRTRTGTLPPRAPRELVPGVDVTAKDMESDEATWALYELWCKAYSKARDRSEMEHRFHRFKSTAASVLSNNEACERRQEEDSVKCLGAFADGYDAQDIVEIKRIVAANGNHPYLIDHINSIAVDVFPPDQDRQSPAAHE